MSFEPRAQRFGINLAAVGRHERATALLNHDEPDGLEGTDGLADTYATNSEQLPQFPFGWKSIARSVVAVPDRLFELPAHLLGAVDALDCRERRCSFLRHRFSWRRLPGAQGFGAEVNCG
jgi:hypothetical protein